MAICPSSVEGGKLPTSYPTLRPPTGLPYTPYPPSTSRLPNHLPYTYPTPAGRTTRSSPHLPQTTYPPPTLHLPYTPHQPSTSRLPNHLPYTSRPAYPIPPSRPTSPTAYTRPGLL